MSLQGYSSYTHANGFKNGEQHHLVLSVSGSWHTLYLDGVQVAQNLSGGNVFSSFSTITGTVIGAQNKLAQAFRGTIGDVRVYNYAISKPQVSALYQERNLVVHYPFDGSVNYLMPNYANMTYDASMIGTASISTSASNIVSGTGSLTLTNTANVPATQYIYAIPNNGLVTQLKLDPNAGLTIGCWVNSDGIANRIMRIIDFPILAGQKGLSIDISGTNMIYSGWNSPPVIDTLSASAKTAMLGTGKSAGAYGTRLLYSGYTGPVMKIRKSTDSSQTNLTDFYADTFGNLTTGANGTGSTLAAWLGGANALVTIWYDQTGNGNHATQTTPNLQPVYNQTSKYVDFGTGTAGGQANARFSLPDGTIPFNNSSFTITFKHGTIGTGEVGIIGCGTPSNNNKVNMFRVNNANPRKYNNFWWNNDHVSTLSYTANSVATFRYLNTTLGKRYFYLNGVMDTNITSIGAEAGLANSVPNTNCWLGHTGYSPDLYLNSPLYYMYVVPSSLSDADRVILEATPT